MTTQDPKFESVCRDHLNRFFTGHVDDGLQNRTRKALRFLTVCEQPLRGKPEGWAAGLIYAVANRYKRACGVPGILNSDFEQMFGVTMSTIRYRAAQIERLLDF